MREPTSLMIEPEIHAKIKILSAVKGTFISDEVENALLAYMEIEAEHIQGFNVQQKPKDVSKENI